jgi:hypothetical protein
VIRESSLLLLHSRCQAVSCYIFSLSDAASSVGPSMEQTPPPPPPQFPIPGIDISFISLCPPCAILLPMRQIASQRVQPTWRWSARWPIADGKGGRKSRASASDAQHGRQSHIFGTADCANAVTKQNPQPVNSYSNCFSCRYS